MILAESESSQHYSSEELGLFLPCRVYESGDHDGVDDVGDEVAALCEGARDERGRRRREHELEEPLGQHVRCKEKRGGELEVRSCVGEIKNFNIFLKMYFCIIFLLFNIFQVAEGEAEHKNAAGAADLRNFVKSTKEGNSHLLSM